MLRKDYQRFLKASYKVSGNVTKHVHLSLPFSIYSYRRNFWSLSPRQCTYQNVITVLLFFLISWATWEYPEAAWCFSISTLTVRSAKPQNHSKCGLVAGSQRCVQLQVNVTGFVKCQLAWFDFEQLIDVCQCICFTMIYRVVFCVM